VGGRAVAAALVAALLATAVAAALVAALLATAPAARGQDDPDDLLGGFDDAAGADEPGVAGSPLRGEWWQVTGSLSLAGSVNWVPHRSAWGGTDYQGLSKLRSRLNLQIDADLPRGWELRAEGFGYYDWAYLARGRGEYTEGVLASYEWDADTQDLWVRGSPFEGSDVKLGRQVVSWGRSETLRVLDVLNPLDNREPGIADIEDLRRSVTMGRFDYYLGNWGLSVIAIPEIRFNQNPPPGSDFNPTPDTVEVPPLPPVPFPTIVEDKPDSLENWEVGLGLTGIFEGWDVSFHFAWHYDDLAVLQSFQPLLTGGVGVLKHSRLWMLGAGGNYTIGGWLLKGEIAWVDGVLFTDAGERSRLDAMLGVEYYGFTNTTIAIEALNRHTFDFPAVPAIGSLFIVAQEDATQAAFRLTRSFLNERLDASAVAILLSGDEEVGSVVRIDGSYDLRDALVLTLGVVLYQEGDLTPLDTWGDNDRFFFELKYSF
jgi:hypothetical protein